MEQIGDQNHSKIIKKFTREEIIKLTQEAEDNFANEKNLLTIPKGKTIIVGDLHGDIEALEKILKLFFDTSENFRNLLLLGDYVDRGHKQIDVINNLLYYKNLMPNRIFMLRGNHEDPYINRHYGFLTKVQNKFSEGLELYTCYNSAFSKMPLAAITWNRIFCVHGGIPDCLDDINDINNLRDDQYEINCPTTMQLVWNDPSNKIKKFGNSIRGPGIKYYGKKVFNRFLENNNIEMLIRAHEKYTHGYRLMFEKRLISLFTSKAYSREVIPKICILDDEGIPEIIQI